MAEVMSFTALDTLIDVTFENRTLQLRQNQLTVDNISRAFRLIPETVLLISDRGTVAIPQEGVFNNVDELYNWVVEGDRVTTHAASVRNLGAASSHSQSGSTARWKPQAFPTNRPRGSNVSLTSCTL